VQSAYGFSWGVYWFAWYWGSVDGWGTALGSAPDANLFISNVMFVGLSILLILFALWAWRSRAASPTVITLVISVVVLLLDAYSTYYVYHAFLQGMNYTLIPIEIASLVLLIVFAYKAVLALSRQAPSPALSEKPTAAIILSSIGGGLLVVVGTLLFLGQIMSTVGFYELIVGSMIMVCASMAYYKKSVANAWGSAIVVLSVIAGINLIALAGGILGMRWKPTSAVSGRGLGRPAAVSTPGTKYCVSCGSQISHYAKFCTHCGAAQPPSRVSQ
jgi:hypothetical protein